MKAGWRRAKIGEIATHSLGKMLDKAKNRGELRPYLRNLNVRWFDFDLSDLNEMRFLRDEEAKYTIEKGDLVVCEGGYPGRAAIWESDEPIHFQKALHRVRFREPHCGKWTLYYLHYEDLEGLLQERFSGTGIQHFTGEALARFEIPLPEPSERQRIVAILDEAFDAIATAKANAEKNLQNARALFESHLEVVFAEARRAGVQKPLGDFVTFRNGINFTKSSRGDSVEIVGVKAFGNNFWAPLDDLDTVTTDGTLPESDVLRENDLLFVRSNGNVDLIGRCMLVGMVARRTTHSGFTIRARINNKGVVPAFLCHFLRSRRARQRMIDSGTGTNIKSLNQASLAALAVPLPSKPIQSRIVDQIESLAVQSKHLESIYERKLTALDALKRSLLHQAFTGQL